MPVVVAVLVVAHNAWAARLVAGRGPEARTPTCRRTPWCPICAPRCPTRPHPPDESSSPLPEGTVTPSTAAALDDALEAALGEDGALHLEDDMAGYAASLPLAHEPGSCRQYSSGTTTSCAACCTSAPGWGPISPSACCSTHSVSARPSGSPTRPATSPVPPTCGPPRGTGPPSASSPCRTGTGTALRYPPTGCGRRPRRSPSPGRRTGLHPRGGHRDRLLGSRGGAGAGHRAGRLIL